MRSYIYTYAKVHACRYIQRHSNVCTHEYTYEYRLQASTKIERRGTAYKHTKIKNKHREQINTTHISKPKISSLGDSPVDLIKCLTYLTLCSLCLSMLFCMCYHMFIMVLICLHSCIHIYVYIYTYVQLHNCLCIYIYVCMYLCIYVSMYVCLYLWVHMQVCIYYYTLQLHVCLQSEAHKMGVRIYIYICASSQTCPFQTRSKMGKFGFVQMCGPIYIISCIPT